MPSDALHPLVMRLMPMKDEASVRNDLPEVRFGGAWMFMLGPKSSRVTAMVHSSSSRGGSGAWAMAVLFLGTKFWMMSSCGYQTSVGCNACTLCFRTAADLPSRSYCPGQVWCITGAESSNAHAAKDVAQKVVTLVEQCEADLYVAILTVQGPQVKEGLDPLLPRLPNPNEQAAGIGDGCLPCSFYGPEPQLGILHAQFRL